MIAPIIFPCIECGKPAEFASGGMKCVAHVIHPDLIPKTEEEETETEEKENE